MEDEAGFTGETLFIAGGKSDYIKADDHLLIKSLFPNASIKSIEGAGHWVHGRKPNELSQSVIEFLSK